MFYFIKSAALVIIFVVPPSVLSVLAKSHPPSLSTASPSAYRTHTCQGLKNILILFFNSKIFPIHRINLWWFIQHTSHSSQTLPFSAFQIYTLVPAPFHIFIDFNVLTLKIMVSALKYPKNDALCQILWVYYRVEIYDWIREAIWMVDRSTEPCNGIFESPGTS